MFVVASKSNCDLLQWFHAEGETLHTTNGGGGRGCLEMQGKEFLTRIIRSAIEESKIAH